MNIVYLQLGSNLGDRKAIFSNAIIAISEHVGKIFIYSKIYESSPWRVDGQSNYLNQIIGVKTILSANDILKKTLKIEKKIGRVRVEKWEERLIDIDIIFFNNDIIETSNLCIPHKYMHKRNFVLKPMKEIAPNLIHPKYNKTIVKLFEESKDLGKVIEYEI